MKMITAVSAKGFEHAQSILNINEHVVVSKGKEKTDNSNSEDNHGHRSDHSTARGVFQPFQGLSHINRIAHV